MKKCLSISIVYAAAAMAGGVFYREFTKLNGFDGITVLGKVHTHLFVLGMMIFIIAALFCAHFKSLPEQKLFKVFLCIYNIGVPITAVMMAVRGVNEVLGAELSKGADSAISGVAGLGHVIAGTGIVLLLVSLKSAARTEIRE